MVKVISYNFVKATHNYSCILCFVVLEHKIQFFISKSHMAYRGIHLNIFTIHVIRHTYTSYGAKNMVQIWGCDYKLYLAVHMRELGIFSIQKLCKFIDTRSVVEIQFYKLSSNFNIIWAY